MLCTSDAGDVGEDVDATQLRNAAFDSRHTCRAVADVEDHVASETLEGSEAIGISIEAEHGRTFFSEALSGCSTDPRSCPSDEGDLSCESLLHLPHLSDSVHRTARRRTKNELPPGRDETPAASAHSEPSGGFEGSGCAQSNRTVLLVATKLCGCAHR